ncbi:cytochrome c biogenesis CcdA family protein [Streptococcus devriesei]|uniref:cytochrome c biogenesis CcdA family protein n=1 Tax=Streptococcus devriesei TaxID=231233 RepID=UPI0003F58036|nr:cytochrome c biogenesis CcdA family protein [Streptococcus devriesei]
MNLQHITILTLFIEGLLSFFSPCVLPILPVYIGVLAGQGEKGKTGELIWDRRKVFSNTLLFTSGIAATFFILAFASSLISRFLQSHIDFFQNLGGVLILMMGFVQIGVIRSRFLTREFSTKNQVYQAGQKVTPVIAFLMGFAFSFSWTPCIGPILASVFLYASTHQGIYSVILILIYCLGFIVPFVLIAVFSQKIVTIFKKQQRFLKYTKLVSGILLIIIGIAILTGSFAKIAHLFN